MEILILLLLFIGLIWALVRSKKAENLTQERENNQQSGDLGIPETWRKLLDRRDVLILDTETTGLDSDAEVVELSIIDTTGRVVFDELIKPTGSVPKDAARIHGITDAVLHKAGAKPWPSHHDAVEKVIRAANVLLVYNLKFDERIIRQTCKKNNRRHPLGSISRTCVMLEYAEYRGVPGPYGDYRWHRLENAHGHECGRTTQNHRALRDCQMVLDVMRAVASC